MLIKKIMWLSLLLLFFIAVANAQEKGKTKKTEPKAKQKKEVKVEAKVPDKKQVRRAPVNPDSLKGFIDANANGIDDRLEFGRIGGKMNQKRKRDRFIDANGDGICDGRESALGLKKAMHRRRGKRKK